MNYSEIIGFVGVGILLFAFVLSQLGIWSMKAVSYNLLNFIGAGLACYSSWLIDFIPFVILEGIWSVVSLVSLIKIIRN